MKLRKFAAMTMAVAMLGGTLAGCAAQPAARHPAVQILPQLKAPLRQKAPKPPVKK